MSATITEERTSTAPPDSTRRAHYVRCPDDKESSAAWVQEARVMGLEVEALCGYRWVPSYDPTKYPVCKACIELAHQALMGENA